MTSIKRAPVPDGIDPGWDSGARENNGETTMANRRKFLLGMGSLAAGGAAAMGTGAFNFANVERSAEISVAGDENAFLALNSESEYTNNSGNRLDFDWETAAGGEGINQDSDYSFTGLFSIENQGSQSVGVWINDDDNNDVASWSGTPSDDTPDFGTSIEGPGNPYALDPGEKVYVNLVVLTRDNSATDLPSEINVVADASQGN
jgi:hypothetical protein